MKISDVSMEELIARHLFWEDFEEKPQDQQLMSSLTEQDHDALLKISYLNQAEEGSLLNGKSCHKLDFYEVDFTEYARLYLAEGQLSAEQSPSKSGLDYCRDYSNIELLIQDINNDGLFALYLKDYEFGFVKPLGSCIYEIGFTDETRMLYKNEPDRFIRDYALAEFELILFENGIDLKQELFDYYHALPDISHPLLSKKVHKEDFLTAKAASEKLGVSIPRVTKMVEEQSIDGYKFGGRLFITVSSVENRIRYIKEHGKPTRGKAPEEKRFPKKQIPSKTRGEYRRSRAITAMTSEMIAACYRGGVMVNEGKTLLLNERDRIVNNTGMNPSSALYYLNAVDALLSNDDIKRDINKTAVDTYLAEIRNDFGKEALIVAAGVCLRRYEETKKRGNTCYYYKELAERHLRKLKGDE